MKSKDIFNVAVRIIGLAFLYQGLVQVPAAFGAFCPVMPPPSFRYLNFRSLLQSFIFIGWPLFIAWWMVRGAPWLMRLAYPEDSATGSARNSTTGSPTAPAAGSSPS